MSHLKTKITVIVLLIACGIAGWVAVTREHDPIYKSKRLSQHLAQVRVGGLTFGGMPVKNSDFSNTPEPAQVEYECEDVDALDAMSKVGTNAIPMLLRMLSSKNSMPRVWFYSLSQKYPIIEKIFHPTLHDAFDNQVRAAAVFHRLGPLGANAVPEIIPMLRDPDLALAGLVVLSSIRPTREADILAITNVLNIKTLPPNMGPPSLLHSAALLTLSSFSTRAEGATDLLLKSLGSTDSRMRGASAVALARMRAQPGKIVPRVMAEVTSGSDAESLALNLWALGEYGQNARIALSLLSNLQFYPNTAIQKLALDTSAKIKRDTNSAAR